MKEYQRNFMINKTFNDLMEGIKELHDKKNHDYASDQNPYSNFEYAANLVMDFTDPVDQVFVAIIGIKLARLGQLLGKDKIPNNESVEDTMRDLTTYCGIWTARYIDNKPRTFKDSDEAWQKLCSQEEIEK